MYRGNWGTCRLSPKSVPEKVRPKPGQAAYWNSEGPEVIELARQTADEITATDGGPSAFVDLVREHQAMVYSIAWHSLHDRAVAEELAQEVFLQLHRNLPSLKSDAHVKHWLRRVAGHRSIDYARRRERAAEVPLDDAPELATPAPAADPILAGWLQRLVASLPPKPRLLVVLRFQEDMELEEIAEALDMPLGTVKSQLQRTLATLREKATRTLGR